MPDEEDSANMGDMAKNAIKAAGRQAKSLMKGESLMVSDDEKNRRLSICRECEFLKNSRCEKCGCFMNFKAKLSSEHCIEGKW